MAVSDPFSHPFAYWVGMETDPRATPEALAEFNHFYSTTHVREVIDAHPGFLSVSRYELAVDDPRGGEHHGPRWLAVYEMKDEAAAEQYLKDNARPWLHRRKYSPWPAARRKAKTTWRMLWRRLASTGSSLSTPESIFMVGMNVPPETEGPALAEFNAFYSDTHLAEVTAAGGYARGTRFELYRGFAPSDPGPPRYCAVYESAAPATEQPTFAPAGLSSGPPVWEQRDALWRLVYRRLPAPP
jgi:hypothetical protein